MPLLLPDTRMLSAPDTWWCLRHGSTPPTTLHHPQWEGRMARGRLRGPQDTLTLPRVTVLRLCPPCPCLQPLDQPALRQEAHRQPRGKAQHPHPDSGSSGAHGRTHTRCSRPPGRPATGHLLHVLCAACTTVSQWLPVTFWGHGEACPATLGAFTRRVLPTRPRQDRAGLHLINRARHLVRPYIHYE